MGVSSINFDPPFVCYLSVQIIVLKLNLSKNPIQFLLIYIDYYRFFNDFYEFSCFLLKFIQIYWLLLNYIVFVHFYSFLCAINGNRLYCKSVFPAPKLFYRDSKAVKGNFHLSKRTFQLIPEILYLFFIQTKNWWRYNIPESVWS